MQRYDSIMSLIFGLLAIATFALFFIFPHDRMPFFVTGCVAIAVRVAQYVIRMIVRQREKERAMREWDKDL